MGECDDTIGSAFSPSESGSWKSVVGNGLRFHAGRVRYPTGGPAAAAAAVPRGTRGERDATTEVLSSRTIAFIGDSNMRYQYLSLAAFLASGHGIWPSEPIPSKKFTVCSESSVFDEGRLTNPAVQALNLGRDFAISRQSRDRRVIKWKWRTFFNQSSRALRNTMVRE